MRSRIIRMLLALTSLLPASGVFGHTPLAPEVILNRMALKLTGRMPTQLELERFRAEISARPEDAEQIIGQNVEVYMQRLEFFGAMDRFHAVWYRIPPGESSKLAAHVVSLDRPYFEIFDKDYLFANGTLKDSYEATGASFAGRFPASSDLWDEVRISAGENRFRSILSNLDLLNRYPDTPTNRNRSRANFVFRAFFCETLSPPTNQKQIAAHSRFYPFKDDDDDHANNPDCVGCHYRLDPIARFFDHWRPALTTTTWYDADQTAAGQVVIPVPGQSPIVFPGASETGLARILTEQPLVQTCIAAKAWEFTYGASVDIPADFQPELIAAFRNRNSFQDAIKSTMVHPFFWSTTTPPVINYGSIAPILTQCAGCHAAELSTVFDPSSYPYDQDHEANVALLSKIYGAINHRDGYMPMPKAPRPKLPAESLSKIRDWILNGANDINGRSSLDMEEIERVLNE